MKKARENQRRLLHLQYRCGTRRATVQKGATRTSMTISEPSAGHFSGAWFPIPSPDARRIMDPS